MLSPDRFRAWAAEICAEISDSHDAAAPARCLQWRLGERDARYDTESNWRMAMKTMLISLVAVMGLSATTGCMAPTEAEEIGDEAVEAEALGESQAAIAQLPTEQNLTCPPVGMCEKASDLCEPGDPTREYWCDILLECSDCMPGDLKQQ